MPTLDATGPVEDLEILEEVCHVVGPRHRDLEGLVARDEGGQLREGLLAGPADPDEHHVAPGVADDPGDLDQVDHGVGEEDEVHVRAAHELVVLVWRERRESHKWS